MGSSWGLMYIARGLRKQLPVLPVNPLPSLSGSKKRVSAKNLKDVKGGEGTHALYQNIFMPAAGVKTNGSR